MYKELIDILLEKLENDLNLEKSKDFIGELLDLRTKDIEKTITHNEEYKEYVKRINSIEQEINKKFENSFEILEIIEKYEIEEYENCRRCEKLMYKYGVYEGMKLITEGMKRELL